MPPRFHEPSAAFAELSRIKLGETDLNGVLAQVAELARRALPRASEASVTLIRGAGPHTAASTGPAARALDALQCACAAGPGLDAAAGNGSVIVTDTTLDRRWPDWAARAVSVGAASALAVELRLVDGVTGALTVYGEQPHAFDDEAAVLAGSFAGYASVAIGNAYLYGTSATLAQQLREAMRSRAVIEQAKGIVMGDRRCTADEAFAILTRVSQSSNRKVRDVAEALVTRAQTSRS